VRPGGWLVQSIEIRDRPGLWPGPVLTARFVEHFVGTRLLHLPQLFDQRQTLVRIFLRHRIDKQLQPTIG
jgi:hypothetical protein